MEQLKKVWQYRFWIAVGLALLLAGVSMPFGSAPLVAETNKKKKQLDSDYSTIQAVSGGQRPNGSFAEAVQEHHGTVKQRIEKIARDLYLEQEKLMSWPRAGEHDLQKLFGHRPFGADLSDDDGRYLYFYRTTIEEQAVPIYDTLDALYIDDKGDMHGTMQVPYTALMIPLIDRNSTPSSAEAWMVQEQLWIHHALFKALRAANDDWLQKAFAQKGKKPADVAAIDRWLEAPIKQLSAVSLGILALDTKTQAENPTLSGLGVEATPDQSQQSNSEFTSGFGGSGGQIPQIAGLVKQRYLSRDTYSRVIPVYVSLLVDQMQVNRVLSHLTNGDFAFQITQVRLAVPNKVPSLQDSTGEELVSGENNAKLRYSLVELNVWGQMRLLEMPAGLVEERKAAAAAAAGAAPPAPAPEEN